MKKNHHFVQKQYVICSVVEERKSMDMAHLVRNNLGDYPGRYFLRYIC